MYYFPDSSSRWEHLTPHNPSIDSTKINEVVSFANANESKMDRVFGKALEGGHFSEPLPEGEIIGPTEPREDPSGLIVHKGKILSQWGPTDTADMTFSVAKSYLSLCAGVAFDQGLIKDLDETVSSSIADPLFQNQQNQSITWRHLLHQTSEWEGELW